MVEKIVDLRHEDLSQRDDKSLIGNCILLKLNDSYRPYLLGEEYCDEVRIWWRNDLSGDSKEACLAVGATTFAGDRPHTTLVESWTSLDLWEALAFVEAELV